MAVEVDRWVCRRVRAAALRPSLRSVTPPVSESRDSGWPEFLNQSEEMHLFIYLLVYLFIYVGSQAATASQRVRGWK